MQSDVDKIKSRLSIVDVVSQYVDLKPAGSRLKGLSPFTKEKTPSFFVSPEQGFYHCFSTDQGGDMFSFVQSIEGLDFIGALKLLADKAGIELTNTRSGDSGDKAKIYEALEAANRFFIKSFNEATVAQSFVERRGITKDSIKRFSIGYARDDWRTLYDALKSDYSDEILLKAGLIKQKNNSTYDVFRDRAMFPIRDIAGRVIGFSGRRLDGEKEAKYLNSPESPVFKKSQAMYGLYEGRDEIRKLGFVILVEGQIDLVMAHQSGHRNTVASSGTAFTPDHLQIIKRYTDNILLAFDPDSAGIKASIKVGELAYREDLNVKSIDLPDEQDPADVITEDPGKWSDLIKSAMSLPVLLAQKAKSTSRNETHFIDTLRKVIIPLITQIDSAIVRQKEIEKVAKTSELSVEVMVEEMTGYLNKQTKKPSNANYHDTNQTTKTKPNSKASLNSKDKIKQAIADKVYVINHHYPKEPQPNNLPDNLPEPSTKNLLSRDTSDYRQLDHELKVLLRDLYVLEKSNDYEWQLRALESKDKKSVEDLNQIIEIRQKLEKLPDLDK